MENKTPIETWKDIPSYEGKYQCSDFGNIKSLNYNHTKKEKLFTPVVNSRGYLCVILWKDGKQKGRTVHSIVAQCFLGHSPDKYNVVIDHKDNNPLNNNVDNLQLTTQRHNSSKDRKSTSGYTGVCWDKRASKWFAQIRIDGKKKSIGHFNCPIAASQAYQNELKQL